VLEFCVNKDGSRIIQELLGNGTAEQKNAIFLEIKQDIVQIANDQSGN